MLNPQKEGEIEEITMDLSQESKEKDKITIIGFSHFKIS